MPTVTPGIVAAGIFLLGIVVVVWSVEIFIEAVVRSAVSLGVSGFFLAVVLAGIDLENAILGVIAASASLSDLALGTVFGEAIFVLAVAVGLAGVAVPFRTTVPTPYLALTVFVPVPAFVLSLDGSISRPGGALLVVLFVPLLFVVYRLEGRTDTQYMVPEDLDHLLDSNLEGTTGNADTAADSVKRINGASSPDRTDQVDMRIDVDDTDENVVEEALEVLVPDLEGRGSTIQLAVAVAAAVGMTVGSAVAVAGAEGILMAFDVSGLAFGATVMSFVASLEELFLTVEPVRRNRPEIAVGNVVGSTVFYVTANAGLVALFHPVPTGGAVLTVHWPMLAVCLLVVVGSLARGRVTCARGATLLGLYGVYWIANYI